MKYIDMETWPRKKHFDLFYRMDLPHLNLTANVDVTLLYKKIKAENLSFFKVFLYGVVRTANEIKEFRYRIRDGHVVEHNLVHPSFTVMTSDDIFSFCTVPFQENMNQFVQHAADNMEAVKHQVLLEDEEGRDDLLFMTSIPWVSFTSISHPIHLNPTDSIPRIAWGKFFEENGRIKMPFSVQAHHALVDGVHVGRFFNQLQDWLNHPENYIP